MAHFAEIDTNNVVIEIVRVNNDVVNNLPFPESESLGIEFLNNLYQSSNVWIQTSYNTRGNVHYGEDGNPDGGIAFRKNYAVIGGTYCHANDAFISPQPYPDWIIDTDTFVWKSTLPKPADETYDGFKVRYVWDAGLKGWRPSDAGDETFMRASVGLFPTNANGTIEITSF